MTKQSGFTLIELMIVVAILGILLAIAMPAYQDYTIRTRISEGLVMSADAKLAVSETRLSDGAFPDSNNSAGISDSITSRYVQSLVVGSQGTVTVTYQNIDGAVNGDTIILEPTYQNNAIQWECTGGSLEAKYRPANCRG